MASLQAQAGQPHGRLLGTAGTGQTHCARNQSRLSAPNVPIPAAGGDARSSPALESTGHQAQALEPTAPYTPGSCAYHPAHAVLVETLSPSLPTSEASPQQVTQVHRQIRKLLAEHTADALKAAAVEIWAEYAQVDIVALCQGGAVSALLATRSQAALVAMRAVLTAGIPRPCLKDVEAILEVLMDPGHRKSLGVVYTPDYVIDNLLNEGLGMRSPGAGRPTICDPFCGGAGFLIRAAMLLEARWDIPADVAFRDCLIGFDCDPLAVANARIIVEMYLASRSVPSASVPLRLFCRDTILTPAEVLWDVAGVDEGFDLVATNPPYVKLQNLAEAYRRELLDTYADLAAGGFSLAMLAPIVGHRMLAPGGLVAMITQNNLFTSLSAVHVRDYLARERALVRILDFGSQKIFHNASAYTCLVFLGRERREEFEYEMLRKSASAETLGAVCFSTLRTKELESAKWRLAPGAHLAHLRTIENAGTPLRDLCDIRVGFATLKDSVFMVRSVGDACEGLLPDGRRVAVERDVTRGAVKVSTMSTEDDLRTNPMRILFPYEERSGKYEIIPEAEMAARYPQAFAYLLAHRESLETRDKGKKVYPAWYAWGRTQGMKAASPKLLTKTFSRGPSFFRDPSDQLFCNGYALTLKASAASEWSLEALQRILNSKVMHYYATLSSVELTGSFQCYQKNFIERFGVPPLSREKAERLLACTAAEVDGYVAERYGLPLVDIEAYLDGTGFSGEAEIPEEAEES